MKRQAVLIRHVLRLEVDLGVQPDGKRGCMRGVSEMTFRLVAVGASARQDAGPIFPPTRKAMPPTAAGASAGVTAEAAPTTMMIEVQDDVSP